MINWWQVQVHHYNAQLVSIIYRYLWCDNMTICDMCFQIIFPNLGSGWWIVLAEIWQRYRIIFQITRLLSTSAAIRSEQLVDNYFLRDKTNKQTTNKILESFLLDNKSVNDSCSPARLTLLTPSGQNIQNWCFTEPTEDNRVCVDWGAGWRAEARPGYLLQPGVGAAPLAAGRQPQHGAQYQGEPLPLLLPQLQAVQQLLRGDHLPDKS